MTDEINMGGPLYGYPESYVVDMNSFKYRREYNHIIGAFEDKLTVGDMYTNDIIEKTLQTIDVALETRFWRHIQDLITQQICAVGDSNHLSIWQANIIQALKAYPRYKGVSLPGGKEFYTSLHFHYHL